MSAPPRDQVKRLGVFLSDLFLNGKLPGDEGARLSATPQPEAPGQHVAGARVRCPLALCDGGGKRVATLADGTDIIVACDCRRK
jgi:hypothetical protein